MDIAKELEKNFSGAKCLIYAPYVVPLLNENLDFYNEKYEFDRSVYKIFKNKGIIPDPFCAI